MMNWRSPSYEVRAILTNLCNAFQFTRQTLHNAISIITDPNFPQTDDQYINLCIASLFISQKLHQNHPIPVQSLCETISNTTSVLQILAQQQNILKQLKYKIAKPLLIDSCLDVAYKWDQFISSVTFVQTKFFKSQSQLNACSTYASQILGQYCQKLAYLWNIKDYNQTKISICLICVCISTFVNKLEQTERHYQKLSKLKIEQNLKHHNHINRSINFIFWDFIQELYEVSQQDLKSEMNYVRKHVGFELKNIGSIANIKCGNKANVQRKKMK